MPIILHQGALCKHLRNLSFYFIVTCAVHAEAVFPVGNAAIPCAIKGRSFFFFLTTLLFAPMTSADISGLRRRISTDGRSRSSFQIDAEPDLVTHQKYHRSTANGQWVLEDYGLLGGSPGYAVKITDILEQLEPVELMGPNSIMDRTGPSTDEYDADEYDTDEHDTVSTVTGEDISLAAEDTEGPYVDTEPDADALFTVNEDDEVNEANEEVLRASRKIFQSRLEYEEFLPEETNGAEQHENKPCFAPRCDPAKKIARSTQMHTKRMHKNVYKGAQKGYEEGLKMRGSPHSS